MSRLDLCLLLIAIIYLFFLQCTPLIVEYYGTRHSWTRVDSKGSYDLEFAASVALGLDSSSRALECRSTFRSTGVRTRPSAGTEDSDKLNHYYETNH